MKKIKKFEHWVDEENISSNISNTNIIQEQNDNITEEELRLQINELINKYESNFGTFIRHNYEGGW